MAIERVKVDSADADRIGTGSVERPFDSLTDPVGQLIHRRPICVRNGAIWYESVDSWVGDGWNGRLNYQPASDGKILQRFLALARAREAVFPDAALAFAHDFGPLGVCGCGTCGSLGGCPTSERKGFYVCGEPMFWLEDGSPWGGVIWFGHDMGELYVRENLDGWRECAAVANALVVVLAALNASPPRTPPKSARGVLQRWIHPSVPAHEVVRYDRDPLEDGRCAVERALRLWWARVRWSPDVVRLPEGGWGHAIRTDTAAARIAYQLLLRVTNSPGRRSCKHCGAAVESNHRGRKYCARKECVTERGRLRKTKSREQADVGQAV